MFRNSWGNSYIHFLVIIQQTFVLMKTSWRRLSFPSSEDVLKSSWSRPIYSANSYLFRRPLPDVLKTSSIRLQDVLPRHLRKVFKASSRRLVKTFFKTSLRHLQEDLRTSSRRLQNVLQRSLQDVLKMYHQIKPFLLTHFQNDFKMYSKRFWDVLQRRLSIKGFA